MNVLETELAGCFIIEPKIYVDERGHFFESFNEHKFQKITGTNVSFVQDNQSYSSKGVLRGLHAQRGEHAQAKLVRVIYGEVIDVAVDVRPHSATFGQHITVVLNGDNKKQLYLPRGFLHGFAVLSDTAVFSYKCDNYYNRESEQGIRYNDPVLRIEWQLQQDEIVVSDKDRELPFFSHVF